MAFYVFFMAVLAAFSFGLLSVASAVVHARGHGRNPNHHTPHV